MVPQVRRSILEYPSVWLSIRSATSPAPPADLRCLPSAPDFSLTRGMVNRLTGTSLETGKQIWETGDIKGFRYLQVTFRNVSEPLKVDSISLNFTSYPVESRGSFESSSPLLNRIWNTGAYTLQMCMTDAYVDCPSREQRQWVGDAYVEAMINYAAFGDPRLTAKLVRQTAQSQQSDGMTMMHAPGDHDVLATAIVDYSLAWILTAHEYYRYTGDKALIKEIYPHCVWQWIGLNVILTRTVYSEECRAGCSLTGRMWTSVGK